MSKAVLISIQPQWCELIASGKKTVEVRKGRPKLETPFKCYIYCTKDPNLQFWTGPRYSYADDHSHNAFDRCGNGKVIGEFVCSGFDEFIPTEYGIKFRRFTSLYETRLSNTELRSYLNGSPGYGWRISDLVIYDKLKDLSEFIKPCKSDLYCEVCGMYSEFTEQCGNKALRLSRPPQSWCYVEDLDGGKT